MSARPSSATRQTAGQQRPVRQYQQRARADRTQATRAAILEAAYEAFVDLPYDDVTLAMIAQRAGVSVPTVQRHFGSKENLLVEGSVSWQADETAHRAVVTSDPAEVVAVLAERYESLGVATVRLLALADRLPAGAVLLDRARSSHAAWLAEVFADHLPGRDGPTRRRRVAQLFTATEVVSWMGMRTSLGLSRSEAERAMADTLRALLAGWAPSTAREGS